VIEPPFLCPEVPLHLITEACSLWRATERELAVVGWPEPYWAFAWAGGQALARHLLDRSEVVQGRSVLDFGAGGGVEAIAARLAGARSVLASDLDPVAVTAIALNAALSGTSVETTTEDLLGRDLGWDVVLVGDVCYDPALSTRLFAWLGPLAERGATVLIGDPGRGNVPLDRVEAVAVYDAPSDVDVRGRYLRATTVYRLRR